MRRNPDRDNNLTLPARENPIKCVVSDASPNAPSLETKYRQIGDKAPNKGYGH